jgi:hypothetical protein
LRCASLAATFGNLRAGALALPFDELHERLCRAVVSLVEDILRDCEYDS